MEWHLLYSCYTLLLQGEGDWYRGLLSRRPAVEGDDGMTTCSATAAVSRSPPRILVTPSTPASCTLYHPRVLSTTVPVIVGARDGGGGEKGGAGSRVSMIKKKSSKRGCVSCMRNMRRTLRWL